METNIFSVLVGMLGLRLYDYLTLRYSYDKLFAETISKSRMEWINNFREELSSFIGYGRAICSLEKAMKDASDRLEYNVAVLQLRAEAEKARVKLITRLNRDVSKYGNEYNLVMEKALGNIDLSVTDCLTGDKYELLLDLARKILEPEWKRVKQEAEGRK